MGYQGKIYCFALFAVLFLGSVNIHAQGIGNNLAFQGILNSGNSVGVKDQALGKAYTAYDGELNCVLYNPAGIANINDFQIAVSYGNMKTKSFERQQFIPVGGSYGVLELIWAGYYTPQLKDDGIRSDKIVYDLNDFTKPDSAVDFFDEDFADWVEDYNNTGINNISLALPFDFLNKKFVASAAYINNPVFDYDRNETVIGVDYGLGRVPSDSNWYIYDRKRSGSKANYIAALGMQMNENINLGISFEYMTANTNDALSNEIFAHMHFIQEQNPNRQLPVNTYYFWHDSLTYGIEGTSDFSHFKAGLGFLYKTEFITFGINLGLPYTIKQNYSYTEYKVTKYLKDTTAAPLKEYGNYVNGSNQVNIPYTFSLGFTVKPYNYIKLAFAYRIIPYGKSSYRYSSYDSTDSKWHLPNLKSFQTRMPTLQDLSGVHLGLEIMPLKYFSFLAGYARESESLRPEDHFKKEKEAPISETYSLGASIHVPYAQIDLAYMWKTWHYLDYYSYHTDYITWSFSRLLAGITFKL